MDILPRDRFTLGVVLAVLCGATAIAGILVAVVGPPKAAQSSAASAQTESVAVSAPAAAAAVQTAQAPDPAPVGAIQPAAKSDVAPASAAAPSDAPQGVATETIQLAATATTRNGPSRRKNDDGQAPRGLVILQIGDSHTAADFFTGELRRRLQKRYGNGGAGYIIAGKPHAGVRTSAVKVAASSGWTYKGIQRSDDASAFWLSGFNANASAANETLTLTADAPEFFDSIEIEALRQPGGGTINISLDGTVKGSFELDGKSVEPLVLRLSPESGGKERVKQIEIKTQSDGPVSIASVAIFDKQEGVSYNSIGFPGATIELLNKFDQNLFADDLRRLNPQIVVLAFGTNEAARKNLDLDRYRQSFEKVTDRITSVLPDAKIVLIGPPDGAMRAPSCTAKPSLESGCSMAALGDRPPAEKTESEKVAVKPAPDAAKPATESDAPEGAKDVSPKEATPKEKEEDCDWHPLPNLDGVRTVERTIAEQHGFTYWNWASIMPKSCGAHAWAKDRPPLMSADHVHFTVAGYTRGAEQFLNTLTKVIDKLRVRPNIARN
jgi:hypothetical protein